MLDAGDPAPDFFLPAADDPAAEYMLSAAIDAGPVVLAFVPGSVPEARPLLDALADFDWAALADQISAFGVCADGAAAERLAAELPFPVLFDRDAYVADLYGVADREAGVEPRRALVLVDRGCRISFAWRASDGEDRIPLDRFRSVVAERSASGE